MRDDFLNFLTGDGAARDPVAAARAPKRVLPKRFYTEVQVAPAPGGFGLVLDGKSARTKAGHALVVAHEPLAQVLAAEWAAQAAQIDPQTMPLTRLVHSAIDHVAQAMDAVAADALRYGASDLVCYRAEAPDALVARENELWNPVLAHAERAYGAKMRLAQGVVAIEQPPEALAGLRARVERIGQPIALAALHVLTTLSGSLLIALAVADGAMTPEAGFAAGELGLDYTAQVWGQDAEARAFRADRERDFLAAARAIPAIVGTGFVSGIALK